MLYFTLAVLFMVASFMLIVFAMVHLVQTKGPKRYGVLLLYVLLLLGLAASAIYILSPLHPMKVAAQIDFRIFLA